MRSGPEACPGNAASRGAAHSGSDDIPATAAVQPMTFFMATEDVLDRIDARGLQPSLPLPLPLPHPHAHSHSHPHRHSQRYGLDLAPRAPKPHHRAPPSMSECTSISWPSPSLASQPGSQQDLDTPLDLSRPMTPVLIDHCHAESATSSLSSPRSSYAASPAPRSRSSPSGSPARAPQSGGGGGGGSHSSPGESLRDTAVPQFIMPSVRIPRRRPFSDAGKALGKLKILLTGQAGLGKTSLISSIAQSCQHIVHMDPIVPTQHSRGATEIYASTRPCPWWQAELEPSNLLMRRRSMAPDEILDRNLCFVDCSGGQTSGGKHAALGYVEAQLSSLLSRPMSDEDLWKLLNSGTEPIVDVVLYLLPPTGPKPADIATLRALQGKTNVIPVLARVDELVAEQTARTQLQAEKILQSQEVDYFSFAIPGAEHASSDVYAVSNNFESDADVMDASLLMNSEYERPLVSTDLQRLVGDLLSPDGCARLRYSASSKCVRWRRQQGPGLSSALMKLSLEGASLSLPPPLSRTPTTRQQQYWRRIEMGSWAESLRESLAAERRGEAPLLLESGEVVSDMLLAKMDASHEDHERRGERRRRDRIPRHQDPLGLLGLAVQLKCNGKQTIELLSSAGVVGYLAAQLSGKGILPKW